jgi:hypothetical protein
MLTQRLIPARALARLLDVEDLVYPLAKALGAMLAAWLVAALTDTQALLVTGLLLPAVAAVSLRGVAAAERSARVPERPLARLRQVPGFQTLPNAIVENLARCAAVVRFAPGEPIALDRERLHVIDAGIAEVRSNGTVLERLRQGDLVRSGAATVTAVTPVAVLTLAPEDLLDCIAPGARHEGWRRDTFAAACWTAPTGSRSRTRRVSWRRSPEPSPGPRA